MIFQAQAALKAHFARANRRKKAVAEAVKTCDICTTKAI